LTLAAISSKVGREELIVPTPTTLPPSRFAVLGSNGYLGRHVALHLQSQGHQVDGYDQHPTSLVPGIAYAPVNLIDPADWENVDTQVDALYWFCGLTGTRQGFEHYEDYLATNELSLLHLLDCLRRRGHRPRVVFPSSRLVYRGTPEPLPEDAPKESKTIYAANKLAAEGFLHAYQAAFGIPHTIYRICVPYANVVGQGYSFGTIGAFIRLAREQHTIPLYGGGTTRRTFTHIQDICSQITATAMRPETEGQTFNIAGETFSLADVATWIADRLGARVLTVPWPESELAIESGDTVFDDTHIRALVPAPLRFCLREWIATTNFTG
jgi:UDP-glucose 4-epimerase